MNQLHHNCLGLSALALTMMFTGCIDDKYDLDDIDSTARISVNQLTLPITIDPVTLSSMVNLKEGQAIKVARDAQGNEFYAIVQQGTFSAQSVNVPQVHVNAPTIPSSTQTINASVSKLRAATGEVVFPLQSKVSDFSYTEDGVDPAIVSISSFKGQVSMDWTISLPDASSAINGCTFRNVVLQLPKGLDLTEDEGGTYNPATGELLLPDGYRSGAKMELRLAAKAVDFVAAGGTLSNHRLSYTGDIYLKSGEAVITAADVKSGATIPTSLTLRMDYKFSDIDITAFTGEIEYDIKGFNIPDISLANLPDVFSQDETHLKLSDPCVLLQIVNPLQPYNLTSEMGFSLTALRNGYPSKTYSIDAGTFQITRPNHNATYNYCVGPELLGYAPTIIPNGDETETFDSQKFFTPASPELVKFSQLEDVIYGNGIPRSLKVDLGTPRIPCQTVTDFPLNDGNLDFQGSYLLFAPMAFEAGSQVVYADVVDGWNDEDVDHMVVEKLTVTLTVTSELPVEGVLSGYPIDKEGKQIGNCTIKSVTIPAGCTDLPLSLENEGGDITHLDGIYYRCVATSSGNSALSPNLTVTLKDMRPTVTGYYEKEL